MKNCAADNEQFRVHISGLLITGYFVDRDVHIREIRADSAPSKGIKSKDTYLMRPLVRSGNLLFAIALARKHRGVYSAVVWANANSQDTVLLSLAAFAKQSKIDCGAKPAIETDHYGKDVKEDAQATFQWLAPTKNRHW